MKAFRLVFLGLLTLPGIVIAGQISSNIIRTPAPVQLSSGSVEPPTEPALPLDPESNYFDLVPTSLIARVGTPFSASLLNTLVWHQDYSEARPQGVWSAGGLLPSGLALSTNGLLSGTPMESGMVQMPIHVEAISIKDQNYPIEILEPLSYSLATTNIEGKSNVQMDWDIRDQLSWVNLLPGETPNNLTWTAKTALPSGFKITKGGIVQGSSAEEGTFSFDANATNNLVNQNTTFKLTLDGAALAAKDISGTDQTACAVGINSKVYCWGHNGSGQLGNGTKTSSTTPVEVLGISNASKITVGLYHSCALTASGEVYCWGDNPLGQLGINSKVDALVPTLVSSLPPAIQVDAGDEFTCAVVTNGSVYCWGYGSNGRLGNGSTTNMVVPTLVQNLTDVKQVSAGKNHACAITVSGDPYCWGLGTYGRLGNGLTTSQLVPVLASNFPTPVQHISAGENNTCVVAGSSGFCLGDNGYGQLGNGVSADSLVASQVVGLSGNVKSLEVYNNHGCAVLFSGEGRCWGLTGSGRIGSELASGTARTPLTVSLINDFQKIVPGINTTWAIRGSGFAKAWGNGASGRLGNGGQGDQQTPVSVLPLY
jgi:alpha-tubulin suppressor-like RCC1 family protein